MNIIRSYNFNNNYTITEVMSQSRTRYTASRDLRLVTSHVQPCQPCILCKKGNQSKYFHPKSWKDASLFERLKQFEPSLGIEPQSCMTYPPLNGNGWKQPDANTLVIHWDNDEHLSNVRTRVALLRKGCGCKTGCLSHRCKCKKSGTHCGPGCKCDRFWENRA